MKTPVQHFVHHRLVHVVRCGVAITALSVGAARATPYASCITNNGSGTMTFFLNESGGNVTITYEDNSVNPSFNGSTTGLNLPSGAYTFALGAHTNYQISVSKCGSGTLSLIQSNDLHGAYTPRGIDVNKNIASTNFGRVYVVESGTGLFEYDSDLSSSGLPSSVQTAGVAWGTPYRIAVAPDDYVMVSDYGSNSAAVWRLDPYLKTSQLFLGPVGYNAGLAAGVHGSEESRPLITGSLANGNCVLWMVDGDLANSSGNYNSLFAYNIGVGPLPWETPPNLTDGPILNPGGLTSIGGGFSFYAGLTQGPPPYNYFYTSNQRQNFSNPVIAIFDATGTNFLWSSYCNDVDTQNGDTCDRFLAASGDVTYSDAAVSPDGRYLAAESINNQIALVALTNGIPDLATLVVYPNPAGPQNNGRGIAWDAADNLYLTSSGLSGAGLAAVQELSLGQASTATTYGNANGPTGFTLTAVQPLRPTLLCSNLTITCGSPIPTNPPAFLDPCCTNVTVTLLNSTTNASDCSQTVYQTWMAIDNCYGTSNLCTRTIAVEHCVPPPAGMVAWWPADGNALDIVGGNNGILGANVSYAEGEVAQAFNFGGGSNAYVHVPNSPGLEIQGPVTVDAWINITALNYPQITSLPVWPIVWKGQIGGSQFFSSPFALGVTNDLNTFFKRLYGFVGNGGSTGTLLLGRTLLGKGGGPGFGDWYHVAMVADGTNLSLYVNGQLDGTTPQNGIIPAANTNDLYIGGIPSPSAYNWTGGIDEVEMFNRALSQSEIYAIYQAGPAGKCKVPLLTCASDKGVPCGSPWSFDPPTVSDPCCGTSLAVLISSNQIYGPCPAVFEAIWQATNCCGSTSTCTQFVTVACCNTNSCITGLYNTGVGAYGSLLSEGNVDPHYFLTTNPDGGGSTAYVTALGQNYLPNDAVSQWIGPDPSNTEVPAGTYTYEINFDVPCTNNVEISGQWAADGGGCLYLDSASTSPLSCIWYLQGGDTRANVDQWHLFSISGITTPGTHTLIFVVTNFLGYVGETPPPTSPTALRVEFLSVTGGCCTNSLGCQVFNSGMTGPNGEVPLPAGTSDPNFVLLSTPPGAGNTAVVSSPTAPNWIPDPSSPGSQWISPEEYSYNSPAGLYHYQLQFYVGCTNSLLTGRLAADDTAGLYLNGRFAGVIGGYTSWTPVNLTSGFIPGNNVLDIYVTNFSYWSGFRAELTNCYFCSTSACTNSCIQFSNVTNIVAYSCSNCIPVDYTVTAADLCCTNGPVSLTFEPPSGTCFGIGTTNTVTCNAASPCGYCNSTNFTVVVIAATNPPIIISYPPCIVVCVVSNGCGIMPDEVGQALVNYGLYNTGVDANGNLLSAYGDVDPHYSIISAPPIPPGNPYPLSDDLPYAFLADPHPYGVDAQWPLSPVYPSGASAWIAPATNTDDYPAGNYAYATQFMLPAGWDPQKASLSGRFAADNQATIYLNNLPVITTTGGEFGFEQWTYFSVNAGLLNPPALNYLEIVVTNYSPSPTGLRLEFTSLINSRPCQGAALQGVNSDGTIARPSQSIPPGTIICSNTSVIFTFTNSCGASTNISVPVLLEQCTNACITLNCAPNKTVSCGSAWTFDSPMVTDSCCSNYSLTLSSIVTNGVSCQQQVITATWTVRDSCSNSATCSQSVTILPSMATLLCTNETVTCNEPIFPPAYVDACCTNVSLTLVSNSVTSIGCTQIVNQTWQAVDLCCDTTNTCTRTVTRLPSSPALACGSSTITAGSPFPTEPPQAIDLCCTNVTVSLLSSMTNGTACTQTVYRAWQAIDLCCDTSTICTQIVSIIPPGCVAGLVWTEQDSPRTNWSAIASSSDGTHLVAVVYGGGIYTSTDSGVTWTQTGAPSNIWWSVASSSDGTHLVAGAAPQNGGGGIYTSANSGQTWTQTSAPLEQWTGLASSSDGTHLVAAALDVGIYISVNSGQTWTQTSTPSEPWMSVASSSDGMHLAAVVDGGGIWTSASSGQTWTQTSAPAEYWQSVASSSDGTHLVAVAGSGQIYTSASSGQIWIQTSAPSEEWYSVTSSSDGSLLLAAAYTNGLYISVNSGQTWLQSSAPVKAWYAVASSSDATKLVAADGNGQIWTSVCSPLSCATNKSVACGSPWSFDPPTLNLPCTNAIPQLISSNLISGPCPAVYQGVWQVVDCCGNTNICSQTVTVVPVPPSLACGNFSIAAGSPFPPSPLPQPNPCCTNVTVMLLGSSTNGTVCGYAVSQAWEATEHCCGLSTVCTQLVSVLSTTPPVINCQSNIVVASSCSCTQVWFTVEASSQSCSNVSVVTYPPSGSFFCQGTNTVVAVATDCCGNSNMCSFTVTVNQAASCVAGVMWAEQPGFPVGFAAPYGLINSIASSSDGRVLVVAAESSPTVEISTDYGVTWTARTVETGFGVQHPQVACSSDGSKMFFVTGQGGVYTSANYGVSWTPVNDSNITSSGERWNSIACSSDGSKVIAASTYNSSFGVGKIALSSNYGVNWTLANVGPLYWGAVASSADGTKLFAVTQNSVPLWTSTDSGVSWQNQVGALGDGSWNALASSADGSKLIAASSTSTFGPGQIAISTNYGTNWTTATVPAISWQAVASSADGKLLLAATAVSGGAVYVSANYGATWAPANVPSYFWGGVASSADGSKLAAGAAAPANNTQVAVVYTSGCTNTSACCLPPPPNMVLWLPFDETNGSTSANLASPAKYGTQVNHPAPWVGSYVANSLVFNGSNYVVVPDYPGIEIGTNDLTIDAWIDLTGTAPSNYVILDKGGLSFAATGYSLQVSTNLLILFVPSGQIHDSTPISAGQWHFIALSLSHDVSRPSFFYVDGAVTSSFPGGPPDLSNTNSLWIAASPPNSPYIGGAPWIGAIDELEIYNRALSTNELYAIYSAGVAGKCKPCCYLNTLSISRVLPNSVEVTWGGCGILEEASSLRGPWTQIQNAASPCIIPATGTAMYFRLVCPLSGASKPVTVTVPANPLWTDTGLSLNGGDTVSITASGSWSFQPGALCGPNGIIGVPSSDTFYQSANQGALIAYVGPDPYQGQWGNGSFFPQSTGYWNIGSSGQFTAPVPGELWLGFNDDAVSKGISDNAGSVTATVSVSAP